MSDQHSVLFVSLGCDKNLVDTEEMLGDLTLTGYSFTDDEEEADIAVVNTCAFINDAKEESIENILSLAQRKTDGQLKALVVTGCLAQRYKDEILKEIPEVDAVIGTTSESELPQILEQILSGTQAAPAMKMDDATKPIRKQTKRVLTTGGYYGYLRIAEGCDKNCTYCAIPMIRGHYRSVPEEELLRQAQTLAEQGVKELIIVAQETTLYGVDLYGEKRLPELLHKLCGVDGIEWIRILYCYPEEITDELIQTIKAEPKILHYLDLPVQHASDKVLRRMGRRTDRKQLEDIIEKLRREIPDICLRTTLISGFPGELDKDHKDLMNFVRKMRFDRLGVFTYSKEEDTPAAKMQPQIPSSLKKNRQKELMLLQQKIAFERAREMEGKILTVMIEGQIVGEDVYAARSYKDAPGVDGMVFVETRRQLMTGDFVKVRITDSQDYDLIGEIVE